MARAAIALLARCGGAAAQPAANASTDAMTKREVRVTRSLLRWRFDDSLVRQLQNVLRKPSALDGNPRCGIVDLTQIGIGEFHGSGANVFFEALELSRTRNWYDPRLLREQPGERDLRWRRVLTLGDALQQLDH